MRPIDAHLSAERIESSDLPNHWKDALLSCLSSIPTIAQPPNDPLTLDDLRDMDGEPVWVILYEFCGETVGMWALVSVDEYTREVILTNGLGGRSTYEEVVADIKAIYRRKPEDEKT